MWSVWNKETEVNGFSAEAFIDHFPHLRNSEIVYIKTVNDKVVQIEGKEILAKVYSIDESLDNEAFIEEYQRIISTPVEEIVEESVN